MTEKLIPNAFFVDNNLPLLDKDVTIQDPDGDGFLNEDEWRHQTNPNDKQSHPPYYTKLFLVSRSQAVAFRLVFMSHDAGVADGHGQAATFQINQRGSREKTHFLKLGDTVEGTNYKIDAFVLKSTPQPSGVPADVSELIVVSLTTGFRLTLPLGKPVDCLEGQALLRDDFGEKADIQVMTTQEFTLKAEPTVRYRLLALTKDGAVIGLPDGKRYIAPPLPKRLMPTPASR